MGALVRMKPKQHEDMKLNKRQRVAKKKKKKKPNKATKFSSTGSLAHASLRFRGE